MDMVGPSGCRPNTEGTDLNVDSSAGRFHNSGTETIKVDATVSGLVPKSIFSNVDSAMKDQDQSTILDVDATVKVPPIEGRFNNFG
jgi:hypothetical protein